VLRKWEAEREERSPRGGLVVVYTCSSSSTRIARQKDMPDALSSTTPSKRTRRDTLSDHLLTGQKRPCSLPRTASHPPYGTQILLKPCTSLLHVGHRPPPPPAAFEPDSAPVLVVRSASDARQSSHRHKQPAGVNRVVGGQLRLGQWTRRRRGKRRRTARPQDDAPLLDRAHDAEPRALLAPLVPRALELTLDASAPRQRSEDVCPPGGDRARERRLGIPRDEG